MAGTDPDSSPVTAAFTFQTLDRREADVFVNGHRHGPAGALWRVTPATAFDPKISVERWPPEGARYVGRATRQSEEGEYLSAIELYIAGGRYEQEGFAALRRSAPHLVDGEQVLFIKADLLGAPRIGAARLRIVGRDGALYRWTDYTPFQSMEEEIGSRYRRALWFSAGRSD